MKKILILPILLISLFCSGQVSEKIKYDLAYQKGREIHVLCFKDKKELMFPNGYGPAISPDGYKLAYTKSVNSVSGFKSFSIIVDLNTKAETKLEINSDNFSVGSWSPDGKYLIFSIFMPPSKWQMGIMKSDNSGVKIFNATPGLGVYSPTWSQDSKNIFAHGWSIYKYDLNGEILDSMSIEETFGKNYYFSSASRFLYTSDNKRIIFNCGINEFMKGVAGPVEAIFSFDTKTKNITRLSEKGMYSSDPEIETDSTIVFAGSRGNGGKSIYRLNLLNNRLSLLVENGGIRPTRSRK